MMKKPWKRRLNKYGTEGVWIISQKKNNFNNLISTETAQKKVPESPVQKF